MENLLHKPFTVNQCYVKIIEARPVPENKAAKRWENDLSCSDLDWETIYAQNTEFVQIKMRSFYL